MRDLVEGEKGRRCLCFLNVARCTLVECHSQTT